MRLHATTAAILLWLTGAVPVAAADLSLLESATVEGFAPPNQTVSALQGRSGAGPLGRHTLSLKTDDSGSSDLDGDGTPDAEDPDMDGDGKADAADPDMDGDGTPDAQDPSPGR